MPGTPPVLSLPMRDGNSTDQNVAAQRRNGFEPTYEGWKLCSSAYIGSPARSFEPTYEGWKPVECDGHEFHEKTF